MTGALLPRFIFIWRFFGSIAICNLQNFIKKNVFFFSSLQTLKFSSPRHWYWDFLCLYCKFIIGNHCYGFSITNVSVKNFFSVTYNTVFYTLCSLLLIWATSQQNKRNGMCAQQRLSSAWASTQSDQSSLCAQWVARVPRCRHVDREDPDQTVWMHRLIWVFAGHTGHFVGFVMRWLIFCCSSDRGSYSRDTKQI